MKKTPIDWVQLGILIVSGVTLIGSFALWCDSRFVHADMFNEEVEARKEQKAEIDSLYIKLIPDYQKATLHHHEVIHQ